ncbi:hypothetical protein CHH83_13565 [Bacillus sp. 7586-K]|nr:hypothetical protein CHH83_13565 [Bacillus sp. 7586-K]
MEGKSSLSCFGGVTMQMFYTVRNGDTLYQIAARWKLPVQAIIAANNLRPPYTISCGEQLSIPPGVNIIRVSEADTIEQLSQYYGIPITEIIEKNTLTPPYVLKDKQLLYIPQGVPYYNVRPGDDLYHIARRFNILIDGKINPEPIRLLNHLHSKRLIPGSKLKIPYTLPLTTGMIAFNSMSNGHYDLFVFDLKSGNVSKLTNQLTDENTTPFWSADNTMIAFVGKQGKVYLANLHQSLILNIDQIKTGTSIQWSPNNKNMAYKKDEDMIIYHIETAKRKKIKIGNHAEICLFLNDNVMVYHDIDSSGNGQLYKINIDGTNKAQITNNRNGKIEKIRITQNRQYAVYLTTKSPFFLFVTHLTTLDTFKIKNNNNWSNQLPIQSKNTLQLAYSSTEEMNEDEWYSHIRLKEVTENDDRILAVTDSESPPMTFSPNGRLISFLSGYKGNKYASEIWIVDTKHTVPIRLLEGEQITSICWSKSI